MLRRTVIPAIAAIMLVSCATAGAKQPAKVEVIEGFTAPAESAASQQPVPSPAAEIQDISGSETAFSPDTTAHTGEIYFSRRHNGEVLSLSLVPGSDVFFSGGADGFIAQFSADGFEETWQVSDIPVQIVAANPDGNLVAAYESDGFSVHRISVWDWKQKTRLYAKRFRDSVISLSWSARGNLLMVGNTSVDGISILDRSTGNLVPVFRSPPGIVSLAVTGASETSMITFGPSGRIRYTDVATGAERANYPGKPDLGTPALLANNLKIAGYGNGTLFVLDATSGKTLASWETNEPRMATSPSDTEPVWLERDGSNGWRIRTGSAASLPFPVPGNSRITAALARGSALVFGTDDGMIYSIPRASATSAPAQSAPVPLVTDTIRIIDDITSDGSRLFFLSSGSLFVSTGPGKAPVHAVDGVDGNRIALLDGALVTWSSEKAVPVLKLSLDGVTRVPLYTPQEGIRSLSVSGSRVAFIEGTSKVVSLDTEADPESAPFIYAGVGFQDAIILPDGHIVVSKSATMRAPSPLILINLLTGETVPLPVSGDLCYGLKSVSGMTVSGFIVTAGEKTATALVTVTVNPDSVSSSVSRTEALYPDEDLAATLACDEHRLVTNLGKGSLVEINRKTGDQKRFSRGISLPEKVRFMDRYVVSLNHDGSLTWFENGTGKPIASSSITAGGKWAEQ